MRASVEGIFPTFTAHFEGRVPWLYLDILGLPTVACGNRVETLQACQALPWTVSASPASAIVVAADWNVLLLDATAQAARPLSSKHSASSYAPATSIRLSEQAIDELLDRTARGFEASLASRFPNWSDIPAPAQLATLSMVWACGANGVEFRFPKFDEALLAGDFAMCAAECHMDDSSNPGLVDRNLANRVLFAAAANLGNGDPDVIGGWPS